MGNSAMKMWIIQYYLSWLFEDSNYYNQKWYANATEATCTVIDIQSSLYLNCFIILIFLYHHRYEGIQAEGFSLTHSNCPSLSDYRSWSLLLAVSRFRTESINLIFWWSINIAVSICNSHRRTSHFVFISPAVPSMSSSFVDGLPDRS